MQIQLFALLSLAVLGIAKPDMLALLFPQSAMPYIR